MTPIQRMSKLAGKLPPALFALGAMLMPTPLLAAPELPCIKEVCIGDGLDKLRNIDWQPVHYTEERIARIRKEVRVRKARTYRGFGNDGVPSYLIVGVFDRDLLGAMSKIKAACEPNELVGTFVSSGGHKTNVHVSLMPNPGTENMVWRVRSITRLFQNLDTRAQRQQVHQDLNARYGKFINPKPGEGGFLFVPVGKESVLTLYLAGAESKQNFGKHPLCEPPGRVNID